MKKVLLVVAALIITMSTTVFAQTAEDLQASKERNAKFQKMNAPENCGLYNIDELARKSTEAKKNSMEITPLLIDLYFHSIGQSSDGVVDASVQKPVLEECVELSKRIKKQVDFVKEASDNISKAKDELKSANMKQKMKAPKSLNYSTELLPMLTQESAFQTQLITTIISNISK